MNTDPVINQRISELSKERKALLAAHVDLVGNIAGDVLAMQREPDLQAVTDEHLDSLIRNVRMVGHNRDRLREINDSLRALRA